MQIHSASTLPPQPDGIDGPETAYVAGDMLRFAREHQRDTGYFELVTDGLGHPLLLTDELARQVTIIRDIDDVIRSGVTEEVDDPVGAAAATIVRTVAGTGFDLGRLIDLGVAGLTPAGQTLLVTAVGEATLNVPTLNASGVLVRCLNRMDSPACRIGAIQAMERLGSKEFTIFLTKAADSEPLPYLADLEHSVAELIGAH